EETVEELGYFGGELRQKLLRSLRRGPSWLTATRPSRASTPARCSTAGAPPRSRRRCSAPAGHPAAPACRPAPAPAGTRRSSCATATRAATAGAAGGRAAATRRAAVAPRPFDQPPPAPAATDRG